MLRFRNTLSGKIEEFRPMREGEVSMYYCGPTVWDYGHIGNFRSALNADILRRYLKFKGFKVTHVMNITDVEDRIIAKSQEAGLSLDDYTAKYIDALWKIPTRSDWKGRRLFHGPRSTFPKWFL